MKQPKIMQFGLFLPVLVFAAGVFFSVCGADGQEAAALTSGPDPKVMRELEFAEALTQMGMPDYAQIVLDRIPKTEANEVLKKRLLIQSYIATGKFEDVKTVIAKEKDQDSAGTWGMKLAMADGYYAWGKYNEASELYNGFFAKYPNGPSEGIKDFFVESAYKFARMLLLMGDKQGAVNAYKNLAKAKLERHIERQVMAETAEVMLQVAEETTKKEDKEKIFKEVKGICDKILWVQDLWFGKAIIFMAHMKVMQDDIAGAQKLIEEYTPQLKTIDDALKESAKETGEDMTSLSPMAQCRYLIAVIMQDEAEKALKAGNKDKALELLLGKEIEPAKGNKKAVRTDGAFQHFMNVFIKYPNTPWAPDAGSRSDRVKAICLNDLGVESIKVGVTPEMWEKVRKAQFLEARTLYNRQIFDQAIDAYVKVLNLFPEGETSIAAISELARCYIEKEQQLDAEMTMRYLAECFSKKKAYQELAGDKLLAIAQSYEERNLQDEKDQVHKIYFQYFTQHARASAMLFSFAERKYTANDFAGALEYYSNIVNNHNDPNLYAHAAFKMALCYGAMGKRTEEIQSLKLIEKYLEDKGVPDVLLLNAKFGIAQGYRQLGQDMLQNPDPKYQQAGNKYFAGAAAEYQKLIKLLDAPDHKFQKNEDMKTSALSVLEGALFYKAFTYQLLTMPEDKTTAYKAVAMKGYTDLVEKFPKSKFIPETLSQLATLYTIFGKAKEAEQAIRQLQKDHPDTPQAQNSDFSLGNNLLKMGRRKEAMTAFKKMFDGSGNYSAQKILIAGTQLLETKEYDISQEAFEKAASMSNERNIQEPARLGQGKCLTEKKEYAKAVEVLEKLMAEFPGSGHTPDTGFYLARAASELAKTEKDADKRFDLFNVSMGALKKVRQHAKKDIELKAKTDLEIGRINELKSQSEKQNGTEDKAKQYLGDAIAAYQQMIMFSDQREGAVRPYMIEAYRSCLPLMFAEERYEDVVADCDKFLSLFSDSKVASEVRVLKNRASVKLRKTGVETPTEEKVEEEPAPKAEAEAPAPEPAVDVKEEK